MDQNATLDDLYTKARGLAKTGQFNEAIELSHKCLEDSRLSRLYSIRFALLIAWSTDDWEKARVSLILFSDSPKWREHH